MAHIEVDFEVWKALTALRQDESHGYNEVLRELLGLPQVTRVSAAPLTARMILESAGRILGGRYLPDGTQLRAKHKGALYYAKIEGGKLKGEGGKTFGSASAAAKAVTKTNVNGLAFWEAKRPNDDGWQKLLALPRFNK